QTLADQLDDLLTSPSCHAVQNALRPGAARLGVLGEEAIGRRLLQRVIDRAGLDVGPDLRAPALQLGPHLVAVRAAGEVHDTQHQEPRRRHPPTSAQPAPLAHPPGCVKSPPTLGSGWCQHRPANGPVETSTASRGSGSERPADREVPRPCSTEREMSDTIDGGWGPPPGLRLHIIRHGDPDYANDWLTPRGHAEAAALAHRADELALDRLFVSPMGRARATAAPLAQACGLDAVVADWAGELRSPTVPDGDGGTAVFWNGSGGYVRAAGAQPWQSWSVFDGHGPAIEAEIERLVQGSRGFLESLGYRRCDAGFERVSEEVEDLSVAIVCHG